MSRVTYTLLRSLRPATASLSPSIRIRQTQFRPQQARNMSDIKSVFTAEACPPAGPYSQAIVAGSQIYVSGQIPADKNGNLIKGSITEKTTLCCENIKAILAETGTNLDRVVKVNIFLDDMAHFAEVNGVFSKYFAHKPARSCVAAKQLPKGVPVEIECIAFSGKTTAKL